MARHEITPQGGLVIHGDGCEMACSLAAKVINPLAERICEKQGQAQMAAFQCALIVHLAVTVQQVLGTYHADAMLATALRQVAAFAPVAPGEAREVGQAPTEH